MTDERLEFYAEKAEQAMDYLQLFFAFLLAVAFTTAVIGLASQFLRIFSAEFSSSAVVDFLSTVLMVGLIGTSFSIAVVRFKDVNRMRVFVSMGLIGAGVGILEDWLGSAQVSGSPSLLLAVSFGLMIFSMILALPVVSGEKIIS
ncbi:MAG: hypothetical protein ABEK10_01165 [Candidatus Nanosalina sp.]